MSADSNRALVDLEQKIRDALGWLEQYAEANDEPYLVTEAIADLHYALNLGALKFLEEAKSGL